MSERGSEKVGDCESRVESDFIKSGEVDIICSQILKQAGIISFD